MSRLKVYHERNSPAGSRVTLSRIKNLYGWVPQLLGVIAASPRALDCYLEVSNALLKGSLTRTECHVILLTVCREYDSPYCAELEADMVSLTGEVPASVTRALFNDKSLRKKKLNGLREFVGAAVQSRGHLDDQQLDAFRSSGFSDEQVAEVLLGVALASYWCTLAETSGLQPERRKLGAAPEEGAPDNKTSGNKKTSFPWRFRGKV